MKRFAIGAALAASLAAGCDGQVSPHETPAPITTSAEAVPHAGAAYLSDTDKRTLATAFETGKAYIESKHVGSTATLRLVTLEGGAQANCEQTPYTSTGPGPEYCNSTTTVLFDAQFADKDIPALLNAPEIPANAVPNLKSDALKYVISHELGHHLQILDDPTSFMQTQLLKEQQADCFAGEMLRTTDPAAIPGATTFIEHMPGDPAHGTPPERAAKFMQGAGGVGCVVPAAAPVG